MDKLNLIWIDLEMTGLSPENDRIIEIATIVTDKELNIVAEGPSMVIHQDKTRMDAMDEWNTRQHKLSGLTDRVLDSELDEKTAERKTVEFLEQHVPKGHSPMCGNSICQDRRFLALYMPTLEAYFHYRHIDVSTLKELSRRWAPKIQKEWSKESKHLALEDIKDSIDELKYYRRTMLSI